MSFAPSTSRSGSSRSSQRGSHQAERPSRASTAGTSVIRTRKASTKTPTANPKPIVLIGPSPSGTKAANTANMITAAATTTREDETNPSSTAREASARVAEPACRTRCT